MATLFLGVNRDVFVDRRFALVCQGSDSDHDDFYNKARSSLNPELKQKFDEQQCFARFPAINVKRASEVCRTNIRAAVDIEILSP